MERYDLKVHRGETFRQELLFRNAAGQPLDLTGSTAFCQVRPEPGSDELICGMECTVSGAEGKVTMVISSLIMRTVPVGCYAYDLPVRGADGNVRYYLGGTFTVMPSVTDVTE